MTGKGVEGGFGLYHVLSTICALGIVAIIIMTQFLPPVRKSVSTAPVSALIYTKEGKVEAKVGDIVRVKHKDRFVSGHATPEGLYVIREIVEDRNIGPVITLENQKFPGGLPVGENSLQAESEFIHFAVYDQSSDDYSTVMTEFKNIGSADGEAVASKK